VRTGFLVAGVGLLVAGALVIFNQLSESCEESVQTIYPWCNDILDHVNLTFVGVLALFAGVVVLALGWKLHWILEPDGEEQAHADVGEGD
jgi:hypothetical protein